METAYLRLHHHDVARILSRQSQEIIGSEMSRLTADEYLEDIIEHMRTTEENTLPDTFLIDRQSEINWWMRPYLIDFLIEVHAAFDLRPETLFLAVNLLDRYCSKRIVRKEFYQMIGCVALFIAAKYCDKKRQVPRIADLIRVCGRIYEKGMFRQMEMHILVTLDWVIGHPTAAFFLELCRVEQQADDEIHCMATYICEIALYHRDFVSTKSSTMADLSLAFARMVLGQDRSTHNQGSESPILVMLQKRARTPSTTLVKKYSKYSLYQVPQRLANFMCTQVAASP